jgi:hypothetical protein
MPGTNINPHDAAVKELQEATKTGARFAFDPAIVVLADLHRIVK